MTDQLRSYFRPIRDIVPGTEHRAHKDMNNRIEGLGRFKSLRQAQRFLTAHDQINTFFRQRRYQISAVSDRHARADAFDLWSGYAGRNERLTKHPAQSCPNNLPIPLN